MNHRSRMLVVASLVTVVLAAAPAARGQDLVRDRVQIALDLTDRRIDQADAIVSASEDPRPRLELDSALEVQGRAKSAFGASQLAVALRLTLESRGHADRAIALVRGLPDPDRVRAQIERTRELATRARERIEECNDDRARTLMASALAMQARAEDAMDAGHYLAALQMTMSARERGLRALRLCNMEENRLDAADRALRRTDEIVARAQDVVGPGAPGAARHALAQAQQLETQAWSEFRGGHADPALRLTQTARALAHRAARLMGAGR